MPAVGAKYGGKAGAVFGWCGLRGRASAGAAGAAASAGGVAGASAVGVLAGASDFVVSWATSGTVVRSRANVTQQHHRGGSKYLMGSPPVWNKKAGTHRSASLPPP